MIIEMARVRVIGRKPELARTLSVLQDAGTVHLDEPEVGGVVSPRMPSPVEQRRRRHLSRVVDDAEAAFADLSRLGARVVETGVSSIAPAAAARRASRLRRDAGRLFARRQELADERDLLRGYAPLFDDLEALIAAERPQRRFAAFLLRLDHAGDAATRHLREALDRVVPGEYELRARAVRDRELALLLLVPAGRADDIERALHGQRVERAPIPAELAGAPLVDALPRLRPRLAEVERSLREVAEQARQLAARAGGPLARALRDVHDEILALDAREHAGETPRSFVIEGWVPVSALAALEARLRGELREHVAVEIVARDAWHGDEAPVVLHNPPLFAPFERLTAMLPLPRYGSVDPTPFTAVVFPMLFGVIVGDVGYGALFALVAGILRWRGRRNALARDLGRIALAIASYSVIFGVLYGELFGDLGHRWLGMRPLWFDRAEAVMPFLALAVSLGLVHLLLGLVIAAVSRRGRPREAAGRGLAALMLALVAVVLLAVFELLPRALFTPAIVALLVAFPLLVALEGFTALLELVTVLGHVLSYARVMALGTASVMLAVVANRMVGAFGGAAIGVVFALLFHLVNFGIAIFSPTIHVLRLHYVEFFGTFFSPGGRQYQPFARWRPAAA